MNKLFKVVNVELRPAPKGSFVMVCLLDYTPDIEDVDPRQEKINQMTADLPKELAKQMEPIFGSLVDLGGFPGMFGQDSPKHTAHRETASILLTSHEYEEMGSPTVGQLLKVDLALTKENLR